MKFESLLKGSISGKDPIDFQIVNKTCGCKSGPRLLTQNKECISVAERLSLLEIAILAGSDDALWPMHHYYEAYDKVFTETLRHENFTLIEIGVRADLTHQTCSYMQYNVHE